MNYTTHTTCRVCHSPDLTPLFSLGEQVVSDFVDDPRKGNRVPIDLELCRRCTLVQAKHTAPSDFLYTRHYWYRSSTTTTMREALLDVVHAAVEVVNLQPGDVVLDIGSNDGTLLRHYKESPYFPQARGVVTVGVEPARNMAAEGAKGIDILYGDFWPCSDEFMGNVLENECKIITACGMFYDLDDPHPFVAGVAKALHPEGVFVAQLQCLKQTVELGDVGNFAHEHLEFYSLKSLQFLLREHGLGIFNIDENAVNGGSYRLFVCHRGAKINVDPGAARRVVEAFGREAAMKLDDPTTYAAFFQRIEWNRVECMKFVTREVGRGKSVWVYGASTKGNVILQWYGLDHYDVRGRTLITGAADRSPEKWGLFTVGTGIPIMSEDYARSQNPDYFLVLPYAFRAEFIEREKNQEWRKRGGKFLFPLPQFEVM